MRIAHLLRTDRRPTLEVAQRFQSHFHGSQHSTTVRVSDNYITAKIPRIMRWVHVLRLHCPKRPVRIRTRQPEYVHGFCGFATAIVDHPFGPPPKTHRTTVGHTQSNLLYPKDSTLFTSNTRLMRSSPLLRLSTTIFRTASWCHHHSNRHPRYNTRDPRIRFIRIQQTATCR